MADVNQAAQAAALAAADKRKLFVEVQRQLADEARERAELVNRLRIQDAMNRKRP